MIDIRESSEISLLVQRNANKTYRDAKGAVNDAYNEARAKAR